MATDQALTNLQKAVADEQAIDAKVETALTAQAASIQTLQNQVATLQQQLANQTNLDPAIQAQADLIEAEVANLQNTLSTVQPPAAPAAQAAPKS